MANYSSNILYIKLYNELYLETITTIYCLSYKSFHKTNRTLDLYNQFRGLSKNLSYRASKSIAWLFKANTSLKS